jgi:hypothetical protein
MPLPRFNRASLVTTIVATAGVAAHAQQYTATLFGPPAAVEVYAYGAGNGRQVGAVTSETSEGGLHAVLWMGPSPSPIDLHPGWAVGGSIATGAGGLQQVGVAYAEDETRAVLWTGTAASVVILNPPGFGYATASRTDGVTQVGSGRGPGTGRGPHALAWTGTAESVVDLHPEGQTNSFASDVDGPWIVGAGTTDFGANYAGYWTARNAESWVLLHPAEGFDSTTAVAISGTNIGGRGSGPATGDATHALLWLDGGAAMVDLHPAGYDSSNIFAMRGGVQGGSVLLSTGNEHAVAWNGSAESMIDLHDLIPGGLWVNSRVTAIDTDGALYGYAFNGNDGVAVKWTPAPVVCGPADLGAAGGVAGADGQLDNNDFIVFIGLFFQQSTIADMGSAGGVPEPDGAFDNNDFIAFINLFFAGC